jgi:Fur family ferric uptake transcriptional regulator
MTVSPQAPTLECANLADAVAALRERGLRLSTARRLVLEALFAADGPVSAEHIARRLGLELTSVYRNLETLERHGLVHHVHLAHGPGLYALRGRQEREYLYCEQCGAVRSLSPEELGPVRERVRERFGYEARFTHFAIVGRCPACLAGRPRKHDDHEHEHSHGDHVHSHPHTHEKGLTGEHEHAHETGDSG